jgi:raffinose/stachyose/melibiose transport system substrate-binding protein
MYKKLGVILLLVCMALSAYAGGKQEAKKEVTIVWWDWQAGFDEQVFQKVATEYHKMHPNVSLERKQYGYPDINVALKTSLAAGEGPDIFEIEPGAPTVSLVRAGQLLELTSLIKDDPEWSEWIKPSLKLRGMYIDNKIYTVPIDVNHLPILYWKQMLKDRGLTAPSTLDEMYRVADALNADGITPLVSMFGEKWPGVDVFVALVRAADPSNQLIDKATLAQVSWEQPLFKEALQAIVAMKAKGVLPPNILEMTWAICLDQFNKKQTFGVYPIGQFGLTSVDEAAMMNDEFGVMPIPKLHQGDRTMYTGGLSMAFGVNAASKNASETVAFLKYFCGPYAQEVIFDSWRTPAGDLVKKKSPNPLFTLQTYNQNNMEIGYRRIDNPDVYQALSDGIDQALLGGDVAAILKGINKTAVDANK